jgi:hypothetical protein
MAVSNASKNFFTKTLSLEIWILDFGFWNEKVSNPKFKFKVPKQCSYTKIQIPKSKIVKNIIVLLKRFSLSI